MTNFDRAAHAWERSHLGPDDASDREDEKAADLRDAFEEALLADPAALTEAIDDDAADHLLELLELLAADDFTVEDVRALRDAWVSRVADRHDWLDAAREALS